MAKTTTLTVTLPDGKTAKRKTARTYTHVVYVEGVTAAALQQSWDASKASLERQVKLYEKTLANYRAGVDPRECSPDSRPAGTAGGEWDRKCTAQFLAEGRYDEYLRDVKERLAGLLAKGRPTRNVPDPGVLGWCGRPDLASKLAASEISKGYHYGIKILPVNERRAP